MATIKICDICHAEDAKSNFRNVKEISKATRRISIKNKYEALRLDTCEEHQNFFKVCKSFDEASKKVADLW